MAQFRFRLISVFLLGLLAATQLSAQNDAPVRTFEFAVFTHTKMKMPIVFQETPGKVRTLDFKPYRRSAGYTYSGPPLVAFARELPATDASSVSRYEVVARVEVSATLRRPLFLFLSDPTSASGLSVTVLDDDPNAFAPGSLVLVNQSGYRLQGTVAGVTADLPPGQVLRRDGATAANVQLALAHNGQFYPAFDQKIVFENRERTVLILLPPARKSSPLVKWIVLTDEIEPEPEARPGK